MRWPVKNRSPRGQFIRAHSGRLAINQRVIKQAILCWSFVSRRSASSALPHGAPHRHAALLSCKRAMRRSLCRPPSKTLMHGLLRMTKLTVQRQPQKAVKAWVGH